MRRYDSYKDSGIAWIGEIPEHWGLRRNKNCLEECKQEVGKSKDYALLSLTKKGVVLRDLESNKGKFPKDFESYKVVQPNNIIFCLFDIDETPRTVGLSSIYGMITGAYNVFTIKGEFYQFNLSSCIRQQNSLTAQFVSFSLSNLANIFYPPQIFTIINLCLL